MKYVNYFFPPLLLRIKKVPPLTSCVLGSFLCFPCGTHTACVLQQDNPIFFHWCTTLLALLIKLGMQCGCGRVCGCACIL